MEILIYTLGGIFFICSIVFSILFVKEKEKNRLLSENNKVLCNEKENLFQKNDTLLKSIDIIKNDIDTTEKKGYYKETITLVSREDKKEGKKGEPYEVNVYVKEKERYTNGMSEIRLDRLELISGYDHSQYSWVLQCVKEKFSSLKETNDIDWLEPLIPLNKQRVDKINVILEKIREKQNGTE